MNFFERQAQARRTSRRLVMLFIMAVIGTVAAMNVVVWMIFGATAIEQRSGEGEFAMLLLTTVITLMAIGLGMLYRMASLKRGGEAIALQLGGQLVGRDSKDLNSRRLLNVVEEMAIASGVPVPKVYVLEQEAAINAFAAGYTTSDAVIGVTRGALQALNRDELQGVIAHEFSHILNGDMRLNMRLVAALFGISVLGLIGQKVLSLRVNTRDKSSTLSIIMILGVTAIVIGAIGLFFARLIRAGVSRHRETLADASAVQFTRQNQGLAGALKKIAGIPAGAQLNDRADADELSHLFFGAGVKKSSWFATHPPILDRIQALDPQFKATDLDMLRAQWLTTLPNGLEEDIQLGLVNNNNEKQRLPDSTKIAVDPQQLSHQVAQPAQKDYAYAEWVLTEIPSSIELLVKQRGTTSAVLLALLLEFSQNHYSDAQMTLLQQHLDAESIQRIKDIHQLLEQQVHPAQRLPLAELVFTELRGRSAEEIQKIADVVSALIQADSAISVFEYCLGSLIKQQLMESLYPSQSHVYRRQLKLKDAEKEVMTLLAVLAGVGHANAYEAKHAYNVGIAHVFSRNDQPYHFPENGISALDAVWPRLDALDAFGKQELIEAMTLTIMHNGVMTISESELLRTLCMLLHCPLPPLFDSHM